MAATRYMRFENYDPAMLTTAACSSGVRARRYLLLACVHGTIAAPDALGAASSHVTLPLVGDCC